MATHYNNVRPHRFTSTIPAWHHFLDENNLLSFSTLTRESSLGESFRRGTLRLYMAYLRILNVFILASLWPVDLSLLSSNLHTIHVNPGAS